MTMFHRPWMQCTCHQVPPHPSRGTPLHQATCTLLAKTASHRDKTPLAISPLPSPPTASHPLDSAKVVNHPLASPCLVSHHMVRRPLDSHRMISHHLASLLSVSHHMARHPLGRRQAVSHHMMSCSSTKYQLDSHLVGSPLAMDRQVRCHSSRHPVQAPVPVTIRSLQASEDPHLATKVHASQCSICHVAIGSVLSRVNDKLSTSLMAHVKSVLLSDEVLTQGKHKKTACEPNKVNIGIAAGPMCCMLTSTN